MYRCEEHALREGEGPGEVTTLHEGAITPEGGLAVASRNEIHFLDAEGNYLSKMTLPYYPGTQTGLLVTENLVVHAAGVRDPMRTAVHPHSVFVYDRRTGELVSSFHPSNPTPGMPGVYQTKTKVLFRGENLLVVNAAPLEVVEYEPRSGRRLRTLVPLDSSLVNDPGPGLEFRLKSRPGSIFTRRHYPRVRYAELLSPNRLLVISVFPREDWIVRPDELALDIPIDEFERSVWDIYDLKTGELVSRTEADRGYVVYDRTSDGGYLATYTTRLDEDVVAKLLFEPE